MIWLSGYQSNLIDLSSSGYSTFCTLLQFQRFVNNTFSRHHIPTTTKQVFFPSMIQDTSIIECKLMDLPTIAKFPSTSEEEWLNCRHFGLRSADLYILVFDVTSTASFQFIQQMRDEIVSSRDLSNTPIIVAANKSDKADSELVREQSRSTQDIVSTVRKTWRASYVECSAKHNWNITAMFKEVASEVISHKENVTKEVEEENQKCCRIFY